MTDRRLPLLATGLLLALSSPVGAQRLDSLPAGARVRVNARCRPGPAVRVYSGRLLRPATAIPPVESDTVYVVASGSAQAIPGDRVRSLELRSGGRSRLASGLLGAGIGALSGAMIGALIAHASARPEDEFRDLVVFAGGVGGGGLGAVIGGLIGATSGTGRWTPVMAPRCS